MTVEELFIEIMDMDYTARTQVMHFLIDNLGNPTPEEVDREWLEIAAHRADEFDNGAAVGIPVEQVFARAWSSVQ